MANVPYPLIRDLCNAAGIEPSRVTRIVLTPSAAHFETFVLIEGREMPEQEERIVRVCNCRECLEDTP